MSTMAPPHAGHGPPYTFSRGVGVAGAGNCVRTTSVQPAPGPSNAANMDGAFSHSVSHTTTDQSPISGNQFLVKAPCGNASPPTNLHSGVNVAQTQVFQNYMQTPSQGAAPTNGGKFASVRSPQPRVFTTCRTSTISLILRSFQGRDRTSIRYAKRSTSSFSARFSPIIEESKALTVICD